MKGLRFSGLGFRVEGLGLCKRFHQGPALQGSYNKVLPDVLGGLSSPINPKRFKIDSGCNLFIASLLRAEFLRARGHLSFREGK